MVQVLETLFLKGCLSCKNIPCCSCTHWHTNSSGIHCFTNQTISVLTIWQYHLKKWFLRILLSSKTTENWGCKLIKTKNTERNKFKVWKSEPHCSISFYSLKKKILHKGRILEEAQRRARPRKFAGRSNLKLAFPAAQRGWSHANVCTRIHRWVILNSPYQETTFLCSAQALRGFQNPPHQHSLALSPSTSTALAPQLCRDPQGRSLTSANSICWKIKNKPEVCSADNNARPCWSQACVRAWAGRGREGSRGKQHLGAALTAGILRAPRVPARNPSSHPTYHGSHRYKKEIPSLPEALREGPGSWVGRQHLQGIWHEKVLSAKAALPHLGCRTAQRQQLL